MMGVDVDRLAGSNVNVNVKVEHVDELVLSVSESE